MNRAGRPVGHGAAQLTSRRTPSRRHVPLPSGTEAAVQAAVRSMAKDRGGLSCCNAVERAILRDMGLLSLVSVRVIEEVERRGTIFTADGDLLPVFKSLATFMNTFRLHALAIGIRPERLDTPSIICGRCGQSYTTATYARHACQPAAHAVDAMPTPGEPGAAQDAAGSNGGSAASALHPDAASGLERSEAQ